MVRESGLSSSGHLGTIFWSYVKEYFYPESISSRIWNRGSVGGSGFDFEGDRNCGGHHPFFSNAVRYRQGSYNQTYRGLVGIRIHRKNDYTLELQTASGLRPAALPFYTFAIENLEKRHKKEFQDWKKITSYVEDYNGFAAQTKARLQTALGNKMRENYSDFREERGAAVADLRNENYYNLSEIFRQVYNQKYGKEKNGHAADFECNNVHFGERYLLRLPDQRILVESDREEDAKPEKLKTIVNEICNERNSDIRRLTSLHSILEIETCDFSNAMKILSERIEMSTGD